MSDQDILTPEHKEWLLSLARKTLENLKPRGSHKPDEALLIDSPIPEPLKEKRGAFVTLHRQGQLRGCIGYVQPIEPLYRTVIDNAVNAARSDPRFPPVHLDEVSEIDIEISVMTVPEPIAVDDIEVGRHGLIAKSGPMRGLLLPQVATEHGWDRETFLNHTCMKAGLPPDSWKEGDVHFDAFTAQVFGEKDMEA
ncbi:MAG: AmmeMemoRadiSam system protein A [Candidatus Sumerlaeia bacterium]